MVIEKLHDPEREEQGIVEIDLTEDANKEPEVNSAEQVAGKVNGSILLRVIMLLFGLFSLIPLAFNSLFLVIYGILSAVTLFQVPVLSILLAKAINGFKRWLVLSVGNLLAFLFPSLGVGLMLAYFIDPLDRELLFRGIFNQK